MKISRRVSLLSSASFFCQIRMQNKITVETMDAYNNRATGEIYLRVIFEALEMVDQIHTVPTAKRYDFV